MSRRFASALLVTAICASAYADDKPADDKPAEVQAPAEPSTRAASRRVRVKLLTGRTVEGVVLAAGTWERRDATQGWVAARRDERGAGVRLWWLNDLDGFQFVTGKELADIRDVGTVSADEAREAEKRRRAAAERTDAERRRADAEKLVAEDTVAKAKALIEAVDAAKAEAAAADAAKSATAVSAADAKRFAELLGRFPPEKWTPESPAAIEHRRVVVGTNPTTEERAFLAAFDEWKKAWDAWSAAQAAVKSLTTPVAAAPKAGAAPAPSPQPAMKK